MKRIMTMTLIALAGCEPPLDSVELVNRSGAPFASKALVVSDVDRDSYVVELSVGVALAVACWDSCYPDKMCKLTSEDVATLGVRPLYQLGGTGAEDDFVLVAQKVGTTTLRVDAACASQDYVVRVVDR